MICLSPPCYVLYTKLHDILVREKNNLKGFGGHFGHVTWISRANFFFHPRMLQIDFSRPSGFRGEDVWNVERRQTIDDRLQTTDDDNRG